MTTKKTMMKKKMVTVTMDSKAAKLTRSCCFVESVAEPCVKYYEKLGLSCRYAVAVAAVVSVESLVYLGAELRRTFFSLLPRVLVELEVL